MTQVWAVTMVRDEEDVVASMLCQLVEEGVDGIVVADNLSQDSTRQILEVFAAEASIPVLVVDDTEVAYQQSRKMTQLAGIAHSQGATWILPVDADECWYNQGDRISEYLRALPEEIGLVKLPLFNHFRTELDLESTDPFVSMIYREPEPGALPKTAVRWHDSLVIAMGNHSASLGADSPFWVEAAFTTMGIRHFPYRSPQQFIRKARNGGAAYAATDFGPEVGAHWRQYNALIDKLGEDQFISDVWDRYYHFVSPANAGLIYDPAPYRRWDSDGAQ